MNFKTPLLLVIFTLLSSYIFAQDKDESAALEKITKDYAKAYSKLSETKDKSTVLKYLDPSLTSVLIRTSIRDKVGYLRSDFDGFDKYLNQLLATPVMKINYKVTEITESFTRGNTGVVSYNVDYENIREEEIWVKGQETVTLVFRKIKGTWKIIHYTVVGFEDEKFKGPCLCELFASSANFVAKTTIPQGKGYTTENLTFSFTVMDNKQVILLNQKPYLWESNGNVWELDENNKPARGIGLASERPEAVYLIVKDRFKEPCASFKVKF